MDEVRRTAADAERSVKSMKVRILCSVVLAHCIGTLFFFFFFFFFDCWQRRNDDLENEIQEVNTKMRAQRKEIKTLQMEKNSAVAEKDELAEKVQQLSAQKSRLTRTTHEKEEELQVLSACFFFFFFFFFCR